MKTLLSIKTFLLSIWTFLKNWNEIMGVAIAALLYIFVVPVVRGIDPSAGMYDGGYFLKPLMVVIFFLLYHSFVWLMIKITWPEVFCFLEVKFEKIVTGNEDITSWQKTLIALSLFFAYFFGLVLVSLSV